MSSSSLAEIAGETIRGQGAETFVATDEDPLRPVSAKAREMGLADCAQWSFER